ncbi:MAG: hypothetical protein RBT34_12055 [Anaerolineaceae bacterium]|jgi:hypothetical protein|nr:hypothetical protein [Anaerolineaceae bacterium]
MLILSERTFDKYYEANGAINPVLKALTRKHCIQSTGCAYLRSIVEANSQHHYQNEWMLAKSLLMRDCLRRAAIQVNKLVPWELKWENSKLDPSKWQKIDKDFVFVVRTNDSSGAISSILTEENKKLGSRRKNKLECKNLAQLMALYALLLATGKMFNRLVGRQLAKGKLHRLTIPINPELLQTEVLDMKFDPQLPHIPINYNGDNVFRPGDMVQFYFDGKIDKTGDRKTDDRRKGWRVENAICVGWQETSRGPKYEEPLFVGGGVAGVVTEAQMKWIQYENLGKPKGYGSDNDIKRCFELKELGPQATKCILIELNSNVTRINVFGGRKDLPP